MRDVCVLYWSYRAAQPSGWYRAYIGEEQRLVGEPIRNTEKLVKLVLRQVEFDNSKWRA